MKIVMLCLSGHYMPGWGYQENYMVRACLNRAWDVTIITHNLILDAKTQAVTTTEAGVSADGKAKLIRLKQRNFGKKLSNKLRICENFYETLEDENPDILFVHGIQFGDLNKVKKFAQAHSYCYIVADCHADRLNSGHSWLSRTILHKIYYKRRIKSVEPYVQKFYYVATESKAWLEEFCGIHTKLEMLSLGGNCVGDEEYRQKRKAMRETYGLAEDELLFLHCGKMTVQKRTLETVQIFLQVASNARLFLIGSLHPEIQDSVEKLIDNDKVCFLGWKTAAEMDEIYCASDVAIQIGTASSTFQQAMCNRCVLILNSRENNKFLLSNDNGFLADSTEQLKDVLERICQSPKIILDKKAKTVEFAMRELDYDNQITRIYREYEQFLTNRS